jgi:integrase
VRRVEVDPAEPRALSHEQLRALQRECDRLPSGRDRAIVQLLMLTGVRIGELAALEVDDVRLTQRTGELVIRHRLCRIRHRPCYAAALVMPSGCS